MGSVSLKGIEKNYGETKVIHSVDLEVSDGEFMVFVGPSGCGKSTILRMIAGLEDITAGELSIGGVVANELPPVKRGSAMVFQNYALYPHMTVAENMGFALKLAKVNRKEIDQSVHRVAEILRIEHLLERKPKELSGGERQRVAIGRAIVRKPKVFLFDEPLSNLDAALRVQMRLELTRLHRELGSTMIYVTHDQVEAMTMGDRIAVFNKGRIEQIGKPSELYSRPTNQFVASFLGSPRMNFLKGCLKSKSDNLIQVTTIGGVELEFTGQTSKVSAGNELTIGVRPEHFELVEPDNGIAARISLIEHLGDSAILHVSSIEFESLVAVKISAEVCIDLAVGDRIYLLPRAGYCILFDHEGNALDCSAQKVKQ